MSIFIFYFVFTLSSRHFHHYEAEDMFMKEQEVFADVQEAVESAKKNSELKKRTWISKDPQYVFQSNLQTHPVRYKQNFLGMRTNVGGYGSGYPGPTLIFPDTNPLLNILNDREFNLYKKIQSFATVILSSISDAIYNYTQQVESDLQKLFDTGTGKLKTVIAQLFDKVSSDLAEEFAKIFKNAKDTLLMNLKNSDDSLIAKINAKFDDALQSSLDITDNYIEKASSNIKSYINSSGYDLINQITLILSNTANTTAILPQLEFMSIAAVKDILENTFTDFNGEIKDILTRAYTDVKIILNLDISKLIDEQSQVIGQIKPSILEAVTQNVNILLNNLKKELSLNLEIISNDSDFVFINNKSNLMNSIKAAIDQLKKKVETEIIHSSYDISASISDQLDLDEQSLTSQIRTFFATG